MNSSVTSPPGGDSGSLPGLRALPDPVARPAPGLVRPADAAAAAAAYPVVELEFLYSARSLADRLEKQRLLRELLGGAAMHEGAWERARDVQQAPTEAGQHRSAGAADLLIGATAERERLVILCDDRDYLGIAAVTGQPVKIITET
jgi:predicted nucleic acid-binding protein